jgi:hypothetical protein
LSKGNLFATGLVAGGALMGVIVAILSVNENIANAIAQVNLEEAISGAIGGAGYQGLGVFFFALMGLILYRISRKD